MGNIIELATKYNISLQILMVVYITSIIPIYFGLFLMLYSLNIKFRFKRVTLLLPEIKKNVKSVKNRKFFILGLLIHIFGWAMPYLYIILTLNYNIYLKYSTLLIFISLLIVIAYRKFYPTSKESYDNKVDIQSCEIVDHEMAKILWEIYDDSFKLANENSPCRQSFHYDDFMLIMGKRDTRKYVVSYDNQVIGLAMITSNLRNSTWISEEYFKSKFPKEYLSKSIYYFLGIALLKKFRRIGIAGHCLKRMFSDVPHGSFVGFDHSKIINSHIGRFPQLLRSRYGLQLSRKYLDSMRYYIVKVNNDAKNGF